MSEKPSRQAVIELRDDALASLNVIAQRLDPLDREGQRARVSLETFIAISIRLIGKTNISRVREEMRTVEISARMGGRPVIDD